jgi:hypothetical protein
MWGTYSDETVTLTNVGGRSSFALPDALRFVPVGGFKEYLSFQTASSSFLFEMSPNKLLNKFY